MFPLPAKTGLVRIGNPDRSSPVLLTCNFHLTVQQVKKSLKGIDAYLLVANSRGINVWCSAAGGLLTNHDVISVLKTSGIEKLVQHRTVILPQLAATGIEPGIIQTKTGWRAVFGPVYIRDIREYLRTGEKSRIMRQVRFDPAQRFQMAVAWAFPLSVILLLVVLPFRTQMFLPLISLVWGLSIVIFMSFPLYSHWLNYKDRRARFILFNFHQGGYLLIIWGLFLLGLVAYGLLMGEFQWAFLLRWGISSFVIILLLSLDLMGSTPLYKSSLQDDRLFSVALDQDKCCGAGFCQDVCPRGCFLIDDERHVCMITQPEPCVRCGACIVQCSFDALSFLSPDGRVISPEIVRRYKLNLLGKRVAGKV